MSDQGFATVPAWLMRKQPTGPELAVYVHLALVGQDNPPKKLLAARTGLSMPTITRALRGLEDKGAIVGRATFDSDGGQGPTAYEVILEQPADGGAA